MYATCRWLCILSVPEERNSCVYVRMPAHNRRKDTKQASDKNAELLHAKERFPFPLPQQ